MTSQANLNSLVEAIRFTPVTRAVIRSLTGHRRLLGKCRSYYRAFDVTASGPFAPTSSASVYGTKCRAGNTPISINRQRQLAWLRRWLKSV